MTVRPLELDASFVLELGEDGLDEPGMREAANVGFHYNLINRVSDAFDFPIPKGRQKARLAYALNIAGKLLKGSYADPIWIRSGDGHIRPAEIDRGREHLLSAPGETDSTLRRAVEAFVKSQWGITDTGEHSVPRELAPYLEKLARHACMIVDDDVDALRASGYSDEMIYEITIVGAFGSALVGLEQLYEVLYNHPSPRKMPKDGVSP
jgi:alkylhydroperoxidase family enzyme